MNYLTEKEIRNLPERDDVNLNIDITGEHKNLRQVNKDLVRTFYNKQAMHKPFVVRQLNRYDKHPDGMLYPAKIQYLVDDLL